MSLRPAVVSATALWLLALGSGIAAGQRPHPAVVRIMAAEGRGASFGSGTLVAVDGDYGLVVTNWHVVRDANGFIVVTFPDGFRSTGIVLQRDRHWDLATLVIRRPRAAPIPLAQEPPRPGDWLTIAGYGRGEYRAATGRCTQYVSPGSSLPYEMVEVGVGAREGDSGGPILNSRGELAGVLFGTSFGRTTGSYCRRVQGFLAVSWETMRRLHGTADSQTLLATSPSLPWTPPLSAGAAPGEVPPQPAGTGGSLPTTATASPMIAGTGNGQPGAPSAPDARIARVIEANASPDLFGRQSTGAANSLTDLSGSSAGAPSGQKPNVAALTGMQNAPTNKRKVKAAARTPAVPDAVRAGLPVPHSPAELRQTPQMQPRPIDSRTAQGPVPGQVATSPKPPDAVGESEGPWDSQKSLLAFALAAALAVAFVKLLSVGVR
ncbi:MAG: trypsin-like peptidase domain-containing protein [Planctomycetota bacterium]